MKILHISHGFPPESAGGTEFYLRSLVRAQHGAGQEVVVLSGCKELRLEVEVETSEFEGVKVMRLCRNDLYFDHYAKLYHPGVEREVSRILAEETPDLVHVHQWIRMTGNLVEIASTQRIASVVTLHDVYTTCPRCFRVDRDDKHCERPLSVASCHDCVPRFGHESSAEIDESIELFREQLASELALAGRVIVANRATAEIVTANTDLTMEDLELLAIPYSPRLSAGPRVTSYPRADEPFRFAFWGSISRRKGCEHLCEAFEELWVDGFPRPTELHIYGLIESEEFAARLTHLAEFVPMYFHGSYELEDLAAADLHMAVFPALGFETYGLVLDEATELGIPCILSDLGAMPLRAGAGALRVSPGDTGVLRRALRKILENAEIWEDLRSNLPLPSPTPGEHAQSLQAIYSAVEPVTSPPKRTALAARRAAFRLMQRESASRRNGLAGGPS